MIEDKDKDKTISKTKTKDKDEDKTKDKDKDKINKIKIKVINKVESIYEIYSNDSWLRLVELNKIDAVDDALNAVWNEICGKNRISSEMINTDKHKDIDGYVSKLTDIINRVDEQNETNMIDEKIHKVSEMDNDTLHLIDSKLHEKLSMIVVQQI